MAHMFGKTGAPWDVARARQKYGLYLSGAEKTEIRAKLPVSQETGEHYADGVFEGGGVLGLAFLGAMRCCSEVGIKWRDLAGTSAGAITASLLAVSRSIDELEACFVELDFTKFVGQKTSPLIVDWDPSDDLERPFHVVVNLLNPAIHQLGLYSSEPFKNWLADALGHKTFSDISKADSGRTLKVVVSDVTRGQMVVLPDDLPDYRLDKETFPVAEAVRLSMSIPLVFAPGELGDSLVVDGGILSNYPVWILDEKDPGKTPEYPTFGFRLYDRSEEQPVVIDSAQDLLKAMFSTMKNAHDRYHMSESKKTRSVLIDLSNIGVTVTEFSLHNDQKDELYRRGYECTKDFLLHQWDWKKHLASRNFM